MTDAAFEGDEAVPKSYIRKIFKGVIEDASTSPEMKVKAGEALAKLEGYTGPSQNSTKREDMKAAVQIVTYSKHSIPKPKLRKIEGGAS